MDSQTDSSLVFAYKEGNDKAFEILLSRHKNRLYTAIFLIVKDRCVAEDLLQETFIKAIDTIKSGRYNEEGKFLPWISRIAHNLAIDNFRKNKRYPTVVVNESSEGLFNAKDFSEDSYEALCVREETFSQLRELIKMLSQPQREVLIMRHYFKMSFQEIAEASGVSINTALGRMRYALINLRKLMNKAQSDTQPVGRNQSF